MMNGHSNKSQNGPNHRAHHVHPERRANATSTSSTSSISWLRQLLFLAVYTLCLANFFRFYYSGEGGGASQADARRREDAVYNAHFVPKKKKRWILKRQPPVRAMAATAMTTTGGKKSSSTFVTNDIRYYELPDPKFTKQKDDLPMRSSYNYANVIPNASWFDSKKQCLETCCSERVAISIDHETHRIKNTVDGLDLADVVIHGHRHPGHLVNAFFAASLNDYKNEDSYMYEIIPCLQNGTIIHIDSYGFSLIHFFEMIRPNMTLMADNVNYVLMTTETDGPQPMFKYRNKLQEDKQMLKWYGNNPKLGKNPPPEDVEKFVGFPLGTSKYHAQMPYLTYYLKARNFTNPFADKSRWTENSTLFNPSSKETTDVLFVKFGINLRSQHRKIPFAMACDGRSRNASDGISCTLGALFTMHRTYSAASRYLFGLSPRGNGVDCFRTYELLLLGVIPVVVDHFDFTGPGRMWEDLPVVVLPSWDLSQEELLQKLRDYVRSEEFLSADFSRGYERLFLGYWRRRVLKDAGREKDIMRDPDSGKEYYLAWKYTKV